MLPKAVLDKIQYFNKQKYDLKNDEIVLEEKSDSGKAVLKCILSKDTVILHDPEKNTLPYLDEHIPNASKCADKFLFELDNDGKWIVHIMEFKKTINLSSLKKSKIQFIMGIYNARAVAGFLNICLKDIYVYSVYRDDRIKSMQDEPLIAMRQANSNPKDIRTINDWNRGRCHLNLDLEEKVYQHIKIQLNQNGNGECALMQSDK